MLEEGGLVDVEIDGDPDLFIAARDFNRLADVQQKVGFIEGAETGKQQGLQEGFENGFTVGIRTTLHWAVLLGKVNALLGYCKEQGDPDTSVTEYIQVLDVMLEEIETAKEKWKSEHFKTEEAMYTQSVTQPPEQVAPFDQPVVDKTVTMATLLGGNDVPNDVLEFQRKLTAIENAINKN